MRGKLFGGGGGGGETVNDVVLAESHDGEKCDMNGSAPYNAEAKVEAEGDTATKLIRIRTNDKLTTLPAAALKGKSLTSGVIKSYYCSEELADLVVRCGSATFKVHKLILISRCDYFKRLFSCAWKESSQGVVELQEEEELVAEALLTFLYTWDYADFFVNSGGAAGQALKAIGGDDDVVLAQAVFNVKVYVAADKYGVAELQQQAADVFGSSLFCASFTTVGSTGSSAGYSHRGACSSCSTGQQRLTPAALTQIIDEVYNGVAAALPNDRILRDIVGIVMSYEINTLMREPRFVALLEGHGNGASGVAADAAKSLAQRLHPEQKRYLCPECGRHFEAVIPIEKIWVECLHCTYHWRGKEWAKAVVLPDLAALWREHQQKRCST